jgi:hypothetical protein
VKLIDIDPLIESIIDEISRRDFLKGAGVAAGLAATGQAKAGFFSSPKLFEPGTYTGSARHLLGGYSDNGSGEGWGKEGKVVDIVLKITKDKIEIIHSESIKASKKMYIDSKSQAMIFDNIVISGETLKATATFNTVDNANDGYEMNPKTNKLEPKTVRKRTTTVKHVLILNKSGDFKARRISTDDIVQDKGYKYHTWGYNGSVKPKGDDLK